MDQLLGLMHDTMNKLVGVIGGSELLLNDKTLTEAEQEFLLKGINQKGRELQAVLDAYYVSVREAEAAKNC